MQLIFALIPPAGMAGGWPCFFVALGMIGGLTAIVGDLAGIFGCLVGLKKSVTGKQYLSRLPNLKIEVILFIILQER